MPGRARGWSAPVPRRLFALPPGRPGGPGHRGRPVAGPWPGRRGRRRRGRERAGVAEPGGGAGRADGPGRARGRGAPWNRQAGRRADRPRICRVHSAGLQVLRDDRAAADPLKPGRGMSPLPEPAARGRLRPLRRGQAGRRPHRCRRAGLRAVPPSRARAPALRDVRQDRSDRGPGPRRARRRMRELLPDAAGPLHRLRPPAPVQLRRRRQPGLQDVHPAGREPSAPAAARTGRQPRGGPRARSATPAIPARCAAAAPARPAVSSGG